MSKITNDGLTRSVSHKMRYSCTHTATVGVKGLNVDLECRILVQGQSLTDAKVRISAYRALSSPAYMSQTAQDPILEAFELYKELCDWSIYEPEFMTEYLELAKKCSDYAVALLSHCRRREEVR